MIVIGSRALYKNNSLLISKERFDKSDIDVIMSTEDFNLWCKNFKNNIVQLVPKRIGKYFAKIKRNNEVYLFEIELREESKSTAFLLDNINDVCSDTYIDNLGTKWNCLKNEYLSLTKQSHLHFPIHFEKNINDYHILKNHLGDFLIDEKMKKYSKLRTEEAEKRFREKHRTPKLNVTNEDFFKISGVSTGRIYVHDDLHEVVKHFDKPVYEMMKNEDKKHLAWCDKDMFNNLPYDHRIKCVQEEAYVIALERYIIPKNMKYWDAYWCYKRSLRRICTTLCSGFFREFAIHHYVDIVNAYDEEFLDKFHHSVSNKTLKPMSF